MPILDLSYPGILAHFGDFAMKGRDESQAFLAWFLQHYYRLDPIEVDDTICDERFDKGIDGIYVSDLYQQIDVFQSRMGTAKPLRSLGDGDLKAFLGTLSQLKDVQSVRHLAATTTSTNLKRLLERLEIERLVAEKYEVRGVFVTNRPRDQNAIELLATSPNLLLYDAQTLERQYLSVEKVEAIKGEAAFDITGVQTIFYEIDSTVKMMIAPVLASDLINMGGLANQELFAWNLRYQLKRSPVNKEIDKSIADPAEHKFFPAFHNGLTVLAEFLRVESNNGKPRIVINEYAVVNGCQSLSALYQRAKHITPELRILTKFVSVAPKSELAAKITDHTNRQNGITGRDLQSNNPLQVRLQNEIHQKYPGAVYYRISRGEHPEWDSSKVLENETLARILLAFDLKEPESCHQQYRLFEDLHSRIFGRPELTAERVVAVMDIDRVIINRLPHLENKQFAAYSLTRFLFHFLLREILEMPESGGEDFCKNPSLLMNEPRGRERIRYTIDQIVGALTNMVDAEVKRRGVEFDWKRDLKNLKTIADIRSRVIPFYQMALGSRFTRPFSSIWTDSENSLLMVGVAPSGP